MRRNDRETNYDHCNITRHRQTFLCLNKTVLSFLNRSKIEFCHATERLTIMFYIGTDPFLASLNIPSSAGFTVKLYDVIYVIDCTS